MTGRLAALTATAVVVATAAPANAATVTFHDPRKDAAARFDLTRVTVVNGDTVVARSKVRNLRGGLEIFQASLTTSDEGSYTARTVRRRDGTKIAKLLDPDGVTVDCGVHSRWRLGEDLVRISFSQDCLSQHGRLRVSAAIGAGNGTGGDPADYTRTVRVRLR